MRLLRAHTLGWRGWTEWSSLRYALAWGYLSSLCFVWAYVTATADLASMPTVVAYAPRWIWATPFVLLAFGVTRSSQVERLPLIAGIAVVLGPVMGLCAPHWAEFASVSAMEPRAGGAASAEIRLRVMTVNMGSRLTDPTALADLVGTVRPDLVLLQECSERADMAFEGAWHYRDDDALCVASRYPLVRSAAQYRLRLPQNDAFVAHYVITVGGEVLDVVNLHLDTPRDAVLSAFQQGRFSQMEASLSRRSQQVQFAREWVEARVNPQRVILAGDFNLTPDSALYRRTWGTFENAFSSQGYGWGFTKRAGVFGARIDHVLTGRDWRVHAAWVERSIGSDHRPLVAELTLPGRL
jgi:endonuclease/exonuclease/phosphatase (EEP) superfamily protein YafD